MHRDIPLWLSDASIVFVFVRDGSNALLPVKARIADGIVAALGAVNTTVELLVALNAEFRKSFV